MEINFLTHSCVFFVLRVLFFIRLPFTFSYVTVFYQF